MAENDQLIVGRRGTGKTTILYRGLIECMRSWNGEGAAKPKTLGIYLDLSKCQTLATAGDASDFEHMFVTEMCDSLRNELQRSWPALEGKAGLFNRIFESAEKKQARQVNELLSALADTLKSGLPRFVTPAGPTDLKSVGRSKNTIGFDTKFSASARDLGIGTGLSLKDEISSEMEERTSLTTQYRLTIADILSIIGRLRELAGLSSVMLFVDEYSALSTDMQRRFTTLLKKLIGNHSGLYIKLCAITDNYTLGSAIILQRDLFELSLDLDAFVERSHSLGTAMSELEKLTERIVTKRLKVYADIAPEELLDDPSTAWVELTRSAMGVPRTLGIILKQAWYRAKNAERSKIRRSDIEYGIKYAAKAYLNQLLGASQDGVAIPAYVTEIWEAIINRAIYERDRAIHERGKEKTSASHFMVLEKNENKLKYLNMFFVVHLLTKGRTTKKEKASRSLYCIDYGISLENNLGYDTDKDIIRQQRFAYDDTLAEFDPYFLKKEEVRFKCRECGKVYGEQDLRLGTGDLLTYCPKDRGDLEALQRVESSRSYTEEETKVIGAIRSSPIECPVTARAVADDVGCYVQKAAKFGEKLEREGLIEREKDQEIDRFTYFNPRLHR